jgi:hypothetical protein
MGSLEIAGFLISILIAVVHMYEVRRLGMQDPTAEDRLTALDRTIVIATIFLGGLIFPGLIYYYGWKDQFPAKAASVRKVSWWLLGLYILCIVAFWALTAYLSYHTGLQDFANLTEQQQQEVQTQNASLASGSFDLYQGDGFSIDVPSGWSEATSSEDQWASFGQSKVWETLYYALGSSGTNQNYQELDVVWNTDISSGQLDQSEATEINSDVNFPNTYSITHPTIAGASQTTMITPSMIGSDDYTIKLYVHGRGNIYFIEGSLTNGTPAEANGLKSVLQSFMLDQTADSPETTVQETTPTVVQTQPAARVSTVPSATIDKNSLYSNSSTFTVTGTAANLSEVLIEFNGTGSGNGGGTYAVTNGLWTATLTDVSGKMGVVVYPPSGQGKPLASGTLIYSQ